MPTCCQTLCCRPLAVAVHSVAVGYSMMTGTTFSSLHQNRRVQLSLLAASRRGASEPLHRKQQKHACEQRTAGRNVRPDFKSVRMRAGSRMHSRMLRGALPQMHAQMAWHWPQCLCATLLGRRASGQAQVPGPTTRPGLATQTQTAPEPVQFHLAHLELARHKTRGPQQLPNCTAPHPACTSADQAKTHQPACTHDLPP